MLDVRPRQQGVALVVTLIMLSVITFMAVTFLALSRRERASVSTSTDQIIAQNMAEAARQRAEADIVADMMVSGSLENYRLRVMTNFINPAGFNQALPAGGDPRINVNFDVLSGPPPTLIGFTNFNAAQREQVIANLLYDPRVPVLVTLPNGAIDFRYYLDLNRNGRFDPTVPGKPGDPQWCGVLERSGLPHSGNNRFIGRYTYVVQPIGHSLDWNAVFNQARPRALNPQGNGYWRNQGAGTWEINYAAFLADLNTNIWGGVAGYRYDPLSAVPTVGGFAFEDAVQLLAYRYGGNYGSLPSFNTLFPAAAAQTQFRTDLIDGYSSGPLWTTVSPPATDPDGFAVGKTQLPWLGADNTNGLFSLQDLFNPAIVGANFANRLLTAGRDTNAYNAGTYYRLIEQIGTGSTPESGKINLNNDNRSRANLAGVIASTNFIPWQPIDFFTNAAAALLADLDLRDTNNVPITLKNIPLYPVNYYTPAVHRALQLAANIYDATTNHLGPSGIDLPHVFRPQFGKGANNSITITNYVEVTEKGPVVFNHAWRDLQLASDRTLLAPNDNVDGVPLVIGAKKGLPNFNELTMQHVADVSRRLQFLKVGGAIQTNQFYQVTLSTTLAVELWNSYSNTFKVPLEVYTFTPNGIQAAITNRYGVIPGLNITTLNIPAFAVGGSRVINNAVWPGFANANSASTDPSFKVPVNMAAVFLTNAFYASGAANTPGFFTTNLAGVRTLANQFPVPEWKLVITNRLHLMLAVAGSGEIVDFVTFGPTVSSIDLGAAALGNTDITGEPSAAGAMWVTNRPSNSTSLAVPTLGILEQIAVSTGNKEQNNEALWTSYNKAFDDKQKAIDRLRVFFGLSPIYYDARLVQNSGEVQAGFTPVRKIYQDISWAANDPLVHYMLEDLQDVRRTNLVMALNPPNQTPPALVNLFKVNPRYRPWGGNPVQSADPNAYNLALKDPLVRHSDAWDFPTNKFPNVGHLGRVHRGTPWQTVYMKSPTVENRTWREWTGNDRTVLDGNGNNNRRDDADFTRPENDRKLFDLFTAAVNDNATLGQLSVTETNLAAWSAVLSGVVVLSNSAPQSALATVSPQPQFSAQVIAPTAVDPNNRSVQRIVDGIIRTRGLTNFNRMNNLGDILAVPELTVDSPFINRTNSSAYRNGATYQEAFGIPDSVYERIPQQIMGLLRFGQPRFVVYAYGQVLKPAADSIVPGSQLCVNYQVAGEMALRVVMRVEGTSNRPRVVVESYNVLPPD